jgi:molecular chaperone GrpE
MSKKDTEQPSEETPSKETAEAKQEPVQKELSPEEKIAELNDKYLRLYADFENYRKRMTKERVDLIKFASEEIFTQVIPVLDDFERAFRSMTEATDIKTIRQGEELIFNKFKNILTQNGLHEMKSVGEVFNPDLHDAVTNVPAPSEKMKGKVVDEVEKGYYLNGKVIRHAKVVVGN